MTKVTPATLENWRKRGILVPGPATAPRYDFRDLVAIRVLVVLRDAGIDLGGLRRVVEYLRKRKRLSAAEVLASTVLITDGHDVYEQLEINGTITMSSLRKPGRVVLHLISFGTLVSEVQRDAEAALRAA